MKTIVILWVGIALSVFHNSPSALAASSEWADLGGGRVRLVAILDPVDDTISAMVEMELEPGWKTYWREPGGSGIPPQFSFSNSRHFLAGEVEFPVPRLLSAGGVEFPGYKKSVGFPFAGRFTSTASDGVIQVDLFAGVCEEICIPATASVSIPFSDLTVSDAKGAMALDLAQAQLPQSPSAGFSIVDVQSISKDRLRVEAKIPPGGEKPALFVEGPSGWYLRPATLISHDDGTAIFELDIAERPENEDATKTRLRFTLVSGARGVEQWLPEDQ